MKTNCIYKLKRSAHLILLNYILREVSKYKSYQKSPVAFFILHCYPASARIVKALVLLVCGLTSPVGGRKRVGPTLKPLRCRILNSLSDVCCNICLVVGFFLLFICFSWHLKGTWLFRVIIILHMLYRVCLLPDNWRTDVCSLEAWGGGTGGAGDEGDDGVLNCESTADANAVEHCLDIGY